MRKIIFTIFGLIISTSAGMALRTDDDILKQLFADNDLTRAFNNDSTEIKNLGNEEDPFKNVYLFMYQNIKEAPRDEAVKALLTDPDYQSYDQTQFEKVVIDGDISEITTRLGSGVEQSVIVDEYTKMRDDYETELQLQMDNRSLLYEALAKEIFINGDLSDSAQVDLLYDLDLIHYLLFNEYITYPDRSGDTAVSLASEELFGKPKLGKVKRTTDTTTVTEPVSASAIAAVSDIVCSIDTELSDAITAFEEANPETVTESTSGTDSGTDTSSSSSSSGPSDSGSTSESTWSGVISNEATETVPDEATVEDFVASLGGGTLGNWDRSLPCDEVFCITVELIPGDAGVSTDSTETTDAGYKKSDNCIACHISYISQRMTDTLSKSLSASKVPMNNFEDATCKDAGSKVNLDINVYAIKKPIFTPENDSTPDAAAKDVDDLKELLWSSRALTSADDATGDTIQDLDAGRILSTRAGGNQEEIINQILAANQAQVSRLQEIFDDFELNARGQTSQDFEDQILIELATFKSYFGQFEESLKATMTPLEALAVDKQYCK